MNVLEAEGLAVNYLVDHENAKDISLDLKQNDLEKYFFEGIFYRHEDENKKISVRVNIEKNTGKIEVTYWEDVKTERYTR